MKKILGLILCLTFLFPMVVNASELAKNATGAILIEVETGTIIFEKNKDEKYAVASLTKMLAQLIILEHIEAGKLSWDEKVTTSANAAGYGGTQIFLQPREVMTVRDLFKGVSMASANDAVVVLAERIAGTEAEFVKLMMQKAKSLGLKNTNFVNPTGLDEENHYSTAYDVSVIARALMKHEEIFKYSSIYEDYLRTDTPNKFWLVNTNKLVRFYEGADGLKTGFTDAAKYCMAVTAKRDGMRLLAIVLGEEQSKVRNKETAELLDYGFNLYKVDILKKRGALVKKVKIDKSNLKQVEVVTEEEVSVLSKKSDTSLKVEEKVEIFDLKTPLKKGDVVGKLKLVSEGKVIGEYNLIVNQDIKKTSIIRLYFNNIKDIISGGIGF